MVLLHVNQLKPYIYLKTEEIFQLKPKKIKGDGEPRAIRSMLLSTNGYDF
jgi:hypothetical protein